MRQPANDRAHVVTLDPEAVCPSHAVRRQRHRVGAGPSRNAADRLDGIVRARKVVFSYSQTAQHDLYLGTLLNTDCGKVRVSVDGVTSDHDPYLDEYGGTTAMLNVRGNVAAGNHTVEITALFDKNAASSGYRFYFDYLWPLVPQDAPDAPTVYPNLSLAIDFDTDHGYKKPPALHLWHLKKVGFMGHADVYMGVFWNNKRRRVEATYPSYSVSIGAWQQDQPLWVNLSGTTLYFSPSAGLATDDIAAHLRAMINVTFPGVWRTSDGGSIHIRSRAPSYTFTISASPQLIISQGTPAECAEGGQLTGVPFL